MSAGTCQACNNIGIVGVPCYICQGPVVGGISGGGMGMPDYGNYGGYAPPPPSAAGYDPFAHMEQLKAQQKTQQLARRRQDAAIPAVRSLILCMYDG